MAVETEVVVEVVDVEETEVVVVVGVRDALGCGGSEVGLRGEIGLAREGREGEKAEFRVGSGLLGRRGRRERGGETECS